MTRLGLSREEEAAQREIAAITQAEEKIRRILLDLEDATGKSVEQVNVDTRNWVSLSTEIFLTMTVRR